MVEQKEEIPPNNTFSKLSDDVVLKIFFQLEDDPRTWARLSCVSRKFSSLISTVCCKSKCLTAFPAISTELLSYTATAPPPCDWANLLKLAVCCPGLLHSGVLLDNSDFGLHRELGPDFSPSSARPGPAPAPVGPDLGPTSTVPGPARPGSEEVVSREGGGFHGWSLYDDLYYDTVYNNSESVHESERVPGLVNPVQTGIEVEPDTINEDEGLNTKKKRKASNVARRPHRAHLASGAWNLSREQGNKLLASRFRGDNLYICDWPGCVHMEEKRNYMVFRGVFRNFKRSRVWRTINDGKNRSKIELKCAYCGCMETWDLHSAFCLKRGFGFHDDGEPVVRAYVCENGHVSGAWTDQPLYT